MRLVLDIQSLQSDSRLRGIGRYTRSVIAELAAANPHLEIVLLLNGSCGDDSQALMEELETSIRGAVNKSTFDKDTPHIYAPNKGAFAHGAATEGGAKKDTAINSAALDYVQCFLPGPTGAYDPVNLVRESMAELLREAFIRELEPDLVHVFSVMEGYADNVVTSIGRLTVDYPVTATFYDLIPLLNPEDYLHTNVAFARHYESKLESLKRADGLLAISHYSGSEAAQHLEYPTEKIAVAPLGPMSSANDHHDANRERYESRIVALGLTPGFLLYVGGSDARKNLSRLVEAWAALPGNLQAEHPLVLAGSMPEQDMDSLRVIAKATSSYPANLRFLGQISDKALLDLYGACSAFVFPSWHEGFGLPALEAMAAGAAVIAANASSLPEVVQLSEALFDPHDVTDITAHLERVLTDDAFRLRLQEHGPQQAAKFSWQKTARDTLDFFEATVDTMNAGRAEGGEFSGIESNAETTWQQRYELRLKAVVVRLVDELALVADARQRTELMSECAAALERNEQQLMQRDFRQRGVISPWLLEGPFDSNYSLALLNRELARALRRAGVNVALRSTEGPGDFDPDPTFMAQNPDLEDMAVAGGAPSFATAVNSRLLYPPRVDDMSPGLNLLHLYGWEEGELPTDWVAHFNQHLYGITTMSRFVSKVLVDNGVTVPQVVAGVGVDHWERVTPDPSFKLPESASGFRFLHVSSCFPRKGIDVLLRVWGRAFTAEDDVTLIIKTFPNPHNEAPALLEAARREKDGYPNVLLIQDDLTSEELKALMMACDALVAPSRGEGFGLPLAEAMMSGLPVVATAYGGHMDFCDADNAYLVDYTLARAQTHFALPNSLWAEPSEESLIRQLRAVLNATPEERAHRAGLGRARLMSDFTWAKIAERVMRSAANWNAPNFSSGPIFQRVGWISSWNTRCGIAGYSGYLLAHCDLDVTVYASHRSVDEELDKLLLPADGPNVLRCWNAGSGDDLAGLREALFADLPGTVVIQFNFGFYEFAALESLIDALKNAGVVVLVVFHSTVDPPQLPDRRLEGLRQVLARCDRLLAHSPQDLNQLKAIGLTHNTALLPHGVMDTCINSVPSLHMARADEAMFRIASFGFLLPHKGLEELLDAVALLRARGQPVSLRMLNAEYPAEVSRQAIESIRSRISQSGLDDLVTLDTVYYTDQECLERLADADLVVFPYQATQESSSAAARHAIASGTPVAVTPLNIFEDVAPAVIELPGCEPAALADGISRIMGWLPSEWQDYRARSGNWRAAHAHSVVAQRLSGMICALRREDAGSVG